MGGEGGRTPLHISANDAQPKRVAHMTSFVVQDIKYTNYNSLFPFGEFLSHQGIVSIKSSFETETIAGYKGVSQTD